MLSISLLTMSHFQIADACVVTRLLNAGDRQPGWNLGWPLISVGAPWFVTICRSLLHKLHRGQLC